MLIHGTFLYVKIHHFVLAFVFFKEFLHSLFDIRVELSRAYSEHIFEQSYKIAHAVITAVFCRFLHAHPTAEHEPRVVYPYHSDVVLDCHSCRLLEILHQLCAGDVVLLCEGIKRERLGEMSGYVLEKLVMYGVRQVSDTMFPVAL